MICRHMSEKSDIVFLLTQNSLSGRALSREIQVSPQKASVVLKDLRENHIVTVSQVGRNNMYSLAKSFLVDQYITLAEGKRSSQVSKQLQPLLYDLHGKYDTMIVYGSFADGTYTSTSDVDIVFIGPYSDSLSDVLLTFPRKIQYECVTWKQFMTLKNHLWEEIKKKHLIYGNVLKVVTTFRGDVL